MIRADVARYIRSLTEGGCWAKKNRFRRGRTGSKVFRWLTANDPAALAALNLALHQFGSAKEILGSGWQPQHERDREILLAISEGIKKSSFT